MKAQSLVLLLGTLLWAHPAQSASCEASGCPAALLQVSSLKTTRSSQPHDRPITFVTVTDGYFNTNLGISLLYRNRANLAHEWILIDNKDNTGISSLYAKAQALAKHPLMVFLHPDVILPNEWYQQLMVSLTELEAIHPDWAVLGTAGVPSWWKLGDPDAMKISSSIVDFTGAYASGANHVECQSLDEHLLVLNAGSPSFDKDLPGFDLYGSDIVMSARKAGKRAFLLNIPVRHKTVDTDGRIYDRATFFAKLEDPAFNKRAGATYAYVQQKWCSSGVLPVHGCTYNVYPCRWDGSQLVSNIRHSCAQECDSGSR